MIDGLGHQVPEFPNYLLIFLIGSNIIYIISSLVLWYQTTKKLLIPLRYVLQDIFELTILGIMSSLHHACDNNIASYCIADYDSLSWIDDFYSIWIITVTINLHILYDFNKKYLYRNIMFSLTLLLFIFQRDNVYTVILPISLCSLNVLYYNRKNINIVLLIISGAFIISARVLKYLDSHKYWDGYTDMYHYVLYHSLWHFLSGLSIISCILSVKAIHIPN